MPFRSLRLSAQTLRHAQKNNPRNINYMVDHVPYAPLHAVSRPLGLGVFWAWISPSGP